MVVARGEQLGWPKTGYRLNKSVPFKFPLFVYDAEEGQVQVAA